MLRFKFPCLVTLIVLPVVVLSQVHGQTVPYKGFGTGTYSPVNGNYGGSGNATHLGTHLFQGNVATSPTAHPLIFNFVISPGNPQETMAANGDKIFFSGSGQVELIPLDFTFTSFSAVWSGHFVVEGGTGRFANVAPGPAPLTVVAINDPFTFATPQWTFRWTLDGKINFQ